MSGVFAQPAIATISKLTPYLFQIITDEPPELASKTAELVLKVVALADAASKAIDFS
jgi:hypothetical protein